MPPVQRTISFDAYGFIPANGVLHATYEELSGAKRNLALVQNASGRGAQILRAKSNEKLIAVGGKMVFNDASSFIVGVRNFVAAMMKEDKTLTIENDSGIFQYDNCYVLNTDTMVNSITPNEINQCTFRVIFVAPKGFAHSTATTTHTDTGITSFPHTETVTIDGTADPEPIITLTIVDASTVQEITFTNQTTGDQIEITGLTLADGDIITIDVANTTVKLNATPVDYNGVFPDFIAGENTYQITVSGSSNEIITQVSYDAERQIYGNKQVSQQILSGASQDISQIALLLKRVDTPALTEYDLFNDNSFETGLWTQFGTQDAVEQNSRLEFTTVAPATKHVSSDQTNFSGVKFDLGPIISNDQEGENASHNYVQLDGNSLTIKVVIFFSGNQHLLYVNGSNVVIVNGNTHNWEFKPVGNNVEVRCDGELKYTTSGLNFNSAAQFEAFCNSHAGLEGFYIDNVYKYAVTDANSDITFEIQTDAAGEPSGTPVTDGTLTIPASVVQTSDFSQIIRGFLVGSLPSLSNATTYHFVVYQTGGNPTNYYLIKFNTGGGLADGTLESSEDAGATWSEQTGDLYIRAWTTLPTGVEIDTVINYPVAHHVVG